MQSLVHRLLEQAFNQGNLAIVDEVVATNSMTHTASWGIPAGRIGLKQWIATFRTAFPDLHCTIKDEIVQGDKMAACWTMSGTHKGMFIGNLPTGRPILAHGLLFARTENGRIVENWFLVDQMGLLQQLGIIPPSGH
jgi:predicted ester cyclase